MEEIELTSYNAVVKFTKLSPGLKAIE